MAVKPKKKNSAGKARQNPGQSSKAKAPANSSAAADWRPATLKRMRALIIEADPAMSEERKWKKPTNGMLGVPVFAHDGIVCTLETYKEVVKLTFAKGARLPDPARLFNASLEGGTRRAIDIRDGDRIDPRAFKALIEAAVAHNGESSVQSRPVAKKVKGGARNTTSARKAEDKAAPKAKKAKPLADGKPVKLLSGGNPQIAKGEGDAPVQAYIAAIPDAWKRDISRRLDALIVRSVPRVRKAMKWNSPFYGLEGQGYFLSFHMFTRYVKVTFFKGQALKPIPPGASKDANVRYADIHAGELDEAQMARWIKQAAALPGWMI